MSDVSRKILLGIKKTFIYAFCIFAGVGLIYKVKSKIDQKAVLDKSAKSGESANLREDAITLSSLAPKTKFTYSTYHRDFPKNKSHVEIEPTGSTSWRETTTFNGDVRNFSYNIDGNNLFRTNLKTQKRDLIISCHSIVVGGTCRSDIGEVAVLADNLVVNLGQNPIKAYAFQSTRNSRMTFYYFEGLGNVSMVQDGRMPPTNDTGKWDTVIEDFAFGG